MNEDLEPVASIGEIRVASIDDLELAKDTVKIDGTFKSAIETLDADAVKQMQEFNQIPDFVPRPEYEQKIQDIESEYRFRLNQLESENRALRADIEDLKANFKQFKEEYDRFASEF